MFHKGEILNQVQDDNYRTAWKDLTLSTYRKLVQGVNNVPNEMVLIFLHIQPDL